MGIRGIKMEVTLVDIHEVVNVSLWKAEGWRFFGVEDTGYVYAHKQSPRLLDGDFISDDWTFVHGFGKFCKPVLLEIV